MVILPSELKSSRSLSIVLDVVLVLHCFILQSIFNFARPSIFILGLWAHHTQAWAAWNRGVQDWFLSIDLHQLDHAGVRARIQEECGHCLPVSVQGCQQREHWVGQGGKNGNKVAEGVGQVWLKSITITWQKVGHIAWYWNTARQAAPFYSIELNLYRTKFFTFSSHDLEGKQKI